MFLANNMIREPRTFYLRVSLLNNRIYHVHVIYNDRYVQ